MATIVPPNSIFHQPSLKNLTQERFGVTAEEQNKLLQDMTKPHIESFNYMSSGGLANALKNLVVEFESPSKQKISLFIKGASVSRPDIQGNKLYPAECRERGITYSGRLDVRVGLKINGVEQPTIDRNIGHVPIMVKSELCNLSRLKPKQLIYRGEEAEEMGGYFIISGIERIVRMLIMQRRNFPMAMSRASWQGRGDHYTEYGVQIRCVRSDQTSCLNVLHYKNDGTANLSFTYRKRQYFAPIILILKALKSECDKYIYDRLMDGKEDDTYYAWCVDNMLRQARMEGRAEKRNVLGFIGSMFRHNLQVPEWYTDTEVARFLLRECVCMHLDNDNDKFNILVYMTQKLFVYAKRKCCLESPDNPMFQEVLLAGHLFQMMLTEKVEMWLKTVKRITQEEIKKQSKGKENMDSVELHHVEKAVSRAGVVTLPVESFFATGDLKNSESGLGLMQSKGLTVVADKLNFNRFLSHFRCVHRGAFFTEMRTTEVRKLLPEAWGFMCPVHTPDGAPCGLLNHLTAYCEVVNRVVNTSTMPAVLCSLGMMPYDEDGVTALIPTADCYTVLLDGKVMGRVPDAEAKHFIALLRHRKVHKADNVSYMMEICFVPKTDAASQYPGIFLFTSLARMMRPVWNYAHRMQEMIGTFEQVYMSICVDPDEFYEGITTHQEIAKHAMLSDMAILTPFSDYNQSPRNMYQCQMGKQTMGSPLQAYKHRSDNKLYRIMTPHSPLVRPYLHDDLSLDNYPLGTNAVVAVISYTGFDMEDAIVINKSSYERGFAHGCVYKGQFIDLKEISKNKGVAVNKLEFGRNPNLADRTSRFTKKLDQLDLDGLPFVGAYLEEKDALYSYYNAESQSFNVECYKGSEPAYVDQVKMLFDDVADKRVGEVANRTDRLQKVFIMLRIVRNPTVGDKFSSRHGQKGVCSLRFQQENMPWTESGMTPDIIFNPHGFPSRMTIGMLIEFMAGKAAAENGLCYDATPFTYTEDDDPITYFGECLSKLGYNYLGTESMYSGTDGRILEVGIFVGIVYYQRLRHMVYDKYQEEDSLTNLSTVVVEPLGVCQYTCDERSMEYDNIQVRTTGAYDPVTKQPVHGRKIGGGIRLGEMERDSIISHGAACLLQDRLFNCSDGSEVHACTKCGSILSPVLDKPVTTTEAASASKTRRWKCRICPDKGNVVKIRVPQVFAYMVAELASINIKTQLTIKQE